MGPGHLTEFWYMYGLGGLASVAVLVSCRGIFFVPPSISFDKLQTSTAAQVPAAALIEGSQQANLVSPIAPCMGANLESKLLTRPLR